MADLLRHGGSSSMIGSITYGKAQVRPPVPNLDQFWIIYFPERGCTIDYKVNFIGKKDGKPDLSPWDDHSKKGDHTKGTGIDIRPIRTDGKNARVTYRDPAYDREATQKIG